jgi:geranylgeranyl reductase family protein
LYDLIIVGAGPAGSSAARAAGKLGQKTLLLEKEIFPRYKPCGGALSNRAISYLDFPLPESICERDINGACIHFGGRQVERQMDRPLSVTLARPAFDHLLMQKAMETGIDVRMGEKVSGYKEWDQCVEVSSGGEVYRARHLLISAGSQSRLKEKIRGFEGKDHYGVCVVTEVPEENEAIGRRLGDILDIHFGVAHLGYGWIFPHDGYYSVGIGGIAESLRNPKGVMQKFLRDNGFLGQYRLSGHIIPMGGLPSNMGCGRVLLAGDAAGMVDSLTGEGISYAIRSGQIAAGAISEKLQDPSMDLVKIYQGACRADFGDELKYSLILARLMHSWPEKFFGLLASSEEFLERFLEIAAARGTYKSCIRWLAPRVPGLLLSP